MGRKALTTFLVLIGLILLASVGLGIASHYSTPDVGIIEGKLKACPGNPNCVCSETYPDVDPSHQTPPIRVSTKDIHLPWKLLKQVIVDQGGAIISEREGYLHAEFTSTVFRFVDDLELRADQQNGMIHIRSTSRVGHSDLGANRKRVEAIRMKLGAGR